MRNPRERLLDMLEAIGHIERYAVRGRQAFEQDELIQSWFVRHLQNIGEAAKALPLDVQAKAPDIPWSKIMGMRHILVHGYFNIDQDLVWDVVEHDLADLKGKINSILQKLD
jgi:uncharacterized protein with HEPN domain